AETYDHVIVSGLGPVGPVAQVVAGDHADVLVLASDGPVSAAERTRRLAPLGCDDGIPSFGLDLAASRSAQRGVAA
ncbi:MAG: hypothetical protein INR64_12185, partial [Caulobacteraceae bacterium]|nr:hypothetical protein [Caulobacter sp.]